MLPVIVRVRGECVAQGQRKGRRGVQQRAEAAAAAAAAGVAAVAVAGQHHVTKMLLVLHLHGARAAGERGAAQLEGARALAARVQRRGGGSGGVHKVR